MPRRPERTLTAHISPTSSRELAEIAVLLRVGRADAPGVPATPRLLPLGETLAIGRGAEPSGSATELLLDDALVSGRHAHLDRRAEGFVVQDLGSKNGTFVDGRRLDGPVPLLDGARLFVGHHGMVFRRVSAMGLDAIRDELRAPFGPVPSVSPVLAEIASKLRRLAPTDAELLFVGETGVGKEVYARAVHAASGRTGRFVPVNCAAIPGALVESELFGYRAGAHSTAQIAKPGLVEEAEGGTLFLDEIGEMPREAQVKLLRFLQDKEVVPLGGTRPRRLDVRVLAATNRKVAPGDPGGLRDDLLARLGATPLLLPPLRSRIEDLGPLVAHLLSRVPGAAGTAFEVPAFRALCMHPWPLNVRELEKVLAAAVALCAGTRPVGLRDLPATIAEPPPPMASVPLPAPSVSAATGRKPPAPGPSSEQLQALLAQHGGNVAEVSRALGRQRAAVWRWIKRFGLGPTRHKDQN